MDLPRLTNDVAVAAYYCARIIWTKPWSAGPQIKEFDKALDYYVDPGGDLETTQWLGTTYRNSVADNEPIVEQKGSHLRWAVVAMGLEVVTLGAMAVICCL